MRQYDPAIARWTAIDPVIHHSYSPYTAFDNNPVFWADPSGADSYKYNYETQQYEHYDDDGKLLNDNAKFADALKWAEGQNNQDNDETQEASAGALLFLTAEEAAKRAAAQTAASSTAASTTAGGLSGTSLGLLGTTLLLHGDTDTTVKEWREKEKERVYVTYTKIGPDGKIYVGRASGFGTPEEVLARRDASHHMNILGFAPAVLDQSGVGTEGSMAIRGREQQLIDYHGGAMSDSDRRSDAVSANRIRGVSKINPRGYKYHQAASAAFGEKYKFTGFLNL